VKIYSNYYNHSCDDPYFFNYVHYKSYFLYNINGEADEEISDIEEVDDE
jgi:hypothetical protein